MIKNYTLTNYKDDTKVYSYPLQKAWINLKITPTEQFKMSRPEQRLKYGDKFYLSN